MTAPPNVPEATRKTCVKVVQNACELTPT